jgi:hypothetical protein
VHESKFHGAFASTSTPSTRHLLDGVAMSVPHRSTSQRGHVIADAPDTLVDFHTGTHSIVVARVN